MNSKVDDYITRHNQWHEELSLLRDIMLSTEMDETIKWGAPVYTVNGKNVASIGAFKHHYGIWFFNGVFLKDKHGLLRNAQENTKAMRQMRFEKGDTIPEQHVRDYILEAIDNQKNGLDLKPEKGIKFEIPPELQSELDLNKEMQKAFSGLTPGKQKEYANYIADAKQAKTKASRLEKIKPMIAGGIGLNDKYRNC